MGGREKLPTGGVDAYGDFPVKSGDDPLRTLAVALEELHPDSVLDLSDEPVLDYRRRHELAAIALGADVRYEGADFAFDPPPRPQLSSRPSVSIIGTGKRTGKTAVSGFAARTLVAAGTRPVVVAMGRGGPPEPEVLRGDEIELNPRSLLELADSGKHAASDYIEDALLGRVPTVGCRRCGGGLAGGVEFSNVAQGVALANEIDADLNLFEGSGSAIPPVRSDAVALIVPAGIPEEYLKGYFGPYRLLLADLVLVTMCESPFGPPSKVSSLVSQIHDSSRRVRAGAGDQVRVIRTVFRPTPVRSVRGARAFVATTAPEAAGDSITKHLEEEHGCRVAKVSHSLSDRGKLEEELKDIKDHADVLLCEIKAGGVDVATRRALEHGLEVVYMDNVPMGVEGDDAEASIGWLGDLAIERFNSSGVSA